MVGWITSTGTDRTARAYALAAAQRIGRKWIVLGMMAASWLVPVVLERLGILAETWSVRDGVVSASSSVVHVGGGATIALLVGTNVLIIVVIGLFANALAAARRDAQRQVTIQAWQLRPAPAARSIERLRALSASRVRSRA